MTSGDAARTRTSDLLLRRQLLYPAELRHRILRDRVDAIAVICGAIASTRSRLFKARLDLVQGLARRAGVLAELG